MWASHLTASSSTTRALSSRAVRSGVAWLHQAASVLPPTTAVDTGARTGTSRRPAVNRHGACVARLLGWCDWVQYRLQLEPHAPRAERLHERRAARQWTRRCHRHEVCPVTLRTCCSTAAPDSGSNVSPNACTAARHSTTTSARSGTDG